MRTQPFSTLGSKRLEGNLLVLLKGQSGDSQNTNIPFRNPVRNLFQREPKPLMEGTR